MECSPITARSPLIQIPEATRYKPSRFNAHVVSDDGVLLIHNTYTGHFCSIPKKLATPAQRYLSAMGLAAPLDRLGQYLFTKGYIVEANTDEAMRWDVRYGTQQFRSDILELFLLATEECNFRCVYCSQTFQREGMLPSVRKGVLQLVSKKLSTLTALYINWFGGEPLLSFDVVEELAPHIQRLAQSAGIPYGAAITTNGYLLSPEVFNKLTSWGVTQFQITIDGLADEHDKHRPLRGSSEGTYDQILQNICNTRLSDKDFTIHIRVNFDKDNYPRLEPLFAVIKQLVGDDPRYRMFFVPVGKWGGPNDSDLNVCGTSEVVGVQSLLTKQARSAGLTSHSLLEQLKPSSQNVCYAARPYTFVIGSDGKVMKCTEALDTVPENIVGQLDETGNLNLNEDKFGKWVRPHYKEDSVCTKCFYVPVCQGASCPLPRVVGGDRPCPSLKTHIQQALISAWGETKDLNHHIGVGRSA